MHLAQPLDQGLVEVSGHPSKSKMSVNLQPEVFGRGLEKNEWLFWSLAPLPRQLPATARFVALFARCACGHHVGHWLIRAQARM